MKYIVIPIFKIILIIGTFPIFFVVLGLKSVWEWSLSPFEDLTEDFSSEDTFGMKEGDRYWYYKTCWDWIIGKKRYKTILTK